MIKVHHKEKNFKGKKFLMTETVSPNYFNSEVKDTERQLPQCNSEMSYV